MKGIFANILAGVPKEELLFDDLSFSIAQQIHARMKHGMITQKALAATLGCSEAAISKHLSGDANLTLKTIAKLLVALSAEMKIMVVQAGSEGFWVRTSKEQEWENGDTNYEPQECGDVSAIAA